MLLTMLFTGLLLGTASAHETSIKLYRVRAGSQTSFLFAGKDGAWLPGPDRIPAQLARAIASSRSLTFAIPFWDKSRMNDAYAVRQVDSHYSPDQVLPQLSPAARAAIDRIVPIEQRKGLTVPRAGMIYSIVRTHFGRHVSDLDFDPEAELDETTRTYLREWTRDIFGREVDVEELRARARGARATARAGGVSFEAAIHRVGIDRGLHPEALMETEPHFNEHERHDRLIGVGDLDRVLVHFGQQLDAADEVQALRWHALSLVPIYVNAEYLTIRNESVLRVMDQSGERLTPGLDRLNAYELSKQRYWLDRLLKRFGEGRAFVAVPLLNVLGRPGRSGPGLKRMLEDAGLEVTPVELGCAPHLH